MRDSSRDIVNSIRFNAESIKRSAMPAYGPQPARFTIGVEIAKLFSLFVCWPGEYMQPRSVAKALYACLSRAQTFFCRLTPRGGWRGLADARPKRLLAGFAGAFLICLTVFAASQLSPEGIEDADGPLSARTTGWLSKDAVGRVFGDLRSAGSSPFAAAGSGLFQAVSLLPPGVESGKPFSGPPIRSIPALSPRLAGGGSLTAGGERGLSASLGERFTVGAQGAMYYYGESCLSLEEARAQAAFSVHEQLPFRSKSLDFTLRKLGPGNGNTLMIVGGIQGDEPGAFSAAALIASHYKIKRGAVWVVPDLNMSSILKRNRGVNGDMNRKFAELEPDDPDYAIINKIKSILLDEQVGLVLNLHDGSGFYRPVWESRKRNPNRWGQSLIIDQESMLRPPFNLLETAGTIEREVNSRLLDPMHRYHINNTLTAEGNEEMAKTLSFFAVCNGKPAFGVEASKELGTEYRSYYHLQIIEAFMRRMGIEFERDFDLTPEGVLAAINSRLSLAAYGNKLVLPLENVRPSLNVLPFKKNSEPDARASKPLLALVPDDRKKDWRVAYGNRTLTRIKPQFMDFDDSLHELEMELDGRLFTVRMGEMVSVRDSFLVRHIPGYRVNAIGAKKEKNGTEADVELARRDFASNFSLDRGGSIYRVEIYRDKAFAGMVLVRFGEESMADERPLTATSGPESSLGF